MTGTTPAVVLDAPGPASALTIREPPVPGSSPGWVLIRVKASGRNRSELHTRLGVAEGRHLPGVPGIEATRVVQTVPGRRARAGSVGHDHDG
jgi:NADPH:quinone reductase